VDELTRFAAVDSGRKTLPKGVWRRGGDLHDGEEKKNANEKNCPRRQCAVQETIQT